MFVCNKTRSANNIFNLAILIESWKTILSGMKMDHQKSAVLHLKSYWVDIFMTSVEYFNFNLHKFSDP